MKPDLGRADADVILVAPFSDEFADRPAGLVAAHRLVGEEGDEVTVAQWSQPAQRDGFTAYRRYRSMSREGLEPGCVVLVSVELTPGTAPEWVDLVFDALAAEQDPHPGGISGHFHVSDDGSKVLNYAEWVSAEAHVEALTRGNGSVGVNERWQRVHGFHGLKSSTVRRYRLAHTGDHGQGLRAH
ncbi:antibiotic biosynthesis monooxygenase [Saccharothrix sp.]|uniref:antibiotic biosynthesis monooxygenase n=1 Tax=Saccharothrix sp. TaxID=1873460 RepID=UPI0028120585|nr:antibiotic biosynthesis monooxygenase [Saccharothrix sp.]